MEELPSEIIFHHILLSNLQVYSSLHRVSKKFYKLGKKINAKLHFLKPKLKITKLGKNSEIIEKYYIMKNERSENDGEIRVGKYESRSVIYDNGNDITLDSVICYYRDGLLHGSYTIKHAFSTSVSHYNNGMIL
ncbi:Hypothetical protein ORPV_680 [Orpheovirus IHUMI-LCC2]|uniref:Uncharacterized protein n=1 Tax=Orpheovirus IHUMI-LCC2 TaxID=2023057 RepID=A0A2I2L4X9_9VIRU|nr:Hypothetical protein ORPV_680 [Orpheovirus IHUMI-LCC2]SNW62584.1 Hypothetical protein ORPV_680 [Orpheovirus IHUMI-LCC2]